MECLFVACFVQYLLNVKQIAIFSPIRRVTWKIKWQQKCRVKGGGGEIMVTLFHMKRTNCPFTKTYFVREPLTIMLVFYMVFEQLAVWTFEMPGWFSKLWPLFHSFFFIYKWKLIENEKESMSTLDPISYYQKEDDMPVRFTTNHHESHAFDVMVWKNQLKLQNEMYQSQGCCGSKNIFRIENCVSIIILSSFNHPFVAGSFFLFLSLIFFFCQLEESFKIRTTCWPGCPVTVWLDGSAWMISCNLYMGHSVWVCKATTASGINSDKWLSWNEKSFLLRDENKASQPNDPLLQYSMLIIHDWS